MISGDGNQFGMSPMHDSEAVADAAKQLDQDRLRDKLEATHRDAFCSIDPISGDYFLRRTLSAAAGAARKAHPDRSFHTVGVGHAATIHFGMLELQ